jgi:flagellar hook-associated protein 2
MASSSSSLGSSSYFAGSSTYAAQLQQTITRAVGIASLPMELLQSQQTTLTNQQTELQNLTSAFSSMQSAVGSLQSATGLGAYSANVADPTVATAFISTGVLAGNYNINVTSVGSQTNAVSKSGLTKVGDPSSQDISSSSTFTLTINDKAYTINNPGGTLTGLAQAIGNSPANVQATVVNVGSSSSPDYRLSLQSGDYAPDTIQLSDGTDDLLNTLSTGTNVTYQVNGQPDTPIASSSRNVAISTGLSVNLNKVGTTSVTVAQSANNIGNALAAFANAYNSVALAVAKNRGQGGGALTGQNVIYQLQNSLRSLADFSGSGSLESLSDLGLTFDTDGNLNFDATTFSHAASTAGTDLLNFIGNANSGGFLQAANNLVTSITDPSTGILTSTSKATANQISALNSKISDEQSTVDQLQKTLTAQMASADAAISSLEAKLNEVTTLFATIQANNKASS